MSKHKNQRFTNLLIAIDKEREAEEKYFQNLSSNKSISERIESGIVWFPVVIVSKVYTVGEQIEMVLERTKHLDLPHKLKSGVGCKVFKYEGNSETTSLRAVVSYVRKNKMAVILNEQSISKADLTAFKGHLGIELIYDDRPYKVMEEAIKKVMATDEPATVSLRQVIEQKLDESRYLLPAHSITPAQLNESQVKALNGVTAAEHLSIIHGPPGTGKTNTLIQVAKALLKKEKRILVCAPSNNAVDLLATQLDEAGLTTLRIGNVTRISDNNVHLTLSEKIRDHADWQHIKKVRIEADKARKSAGKFKRSFGNKERSQRTAMFNEARDLKKWARELEDKLLDTIISESRVICSTLIGVSHKSINQLRFRTLIIDEASQALEPECWNAMLKAERVILAGDHLQLSPTVKSREAAELGLSETLLSRMTDKIRHTYLLEVQYRMNEKILSFSNQRFYGSKLTSSPVVANWNLDEEPLVLIDTSGCGFDEELNPTSLSRYNEGEYFILREHFIQSKEAYAGCSVGIISPYSEQVKYLRSKVEEDVFQEADITVNSIDGFQGQEKDVIYISLVRSNSDGEIGFLSDERRLNVAMTRAKKKLIILGDFSTLSVSPLFSDLAEHVEAVGTYKSAWEYMSV